jgi:hypothetical protein
VSAPRSDPPLTAELDEYEQRPVRDVGETPAAPLITGRPHRPELSPAPDDLRAPRPASVDARSAGKQAYRRYRRPRLGRPATSQRRSEPGFAGDRKLRCALHTADSYVWRRATRRWSARRGGLRPSRSRSSAEGSDQTSRGRVGSTSSVASGPNSPDTEHGQRCRGDLAGELWRVDSRAAAERPPLPHHDP